MNKYRVSTFWLLLAIVQVPLICMQMLKTTLTRSMSVKKIHFDLKKLYAMQEELQNIIDKAEEFWVNLQTNFVKPNLLIFDKQATQISECIAYLDSMKSFLKEYKDCLGEEHNYKRMKALKKRMRMALDILEEFKLVDLELQPGKEENSLNSDKLNERNRISELFKSIPRDPLWKASRQEIIELCSKIRLYKNADQDEHNEDLKANAFFNKNHALINLAETIIEDSGFLQIFEKEGLTKNGKLKIDGTSLY